ncbi:hypothetical protein OUZ56_007016 [Daphnia magna]|uniref:Uncharacterized protein n=1 Tax=Daphnia magna TaxID=35525 RepID=A0ABQ9YXD7_9CRUS|nr:hypothetical protein OUZ56_007016 [Daphnia magna]
MYATIRKLPGTKKEFPSVKSVIDKRTPASFKPRSSAKPSKDTVQIKPEDRRIRYRAKPSVKEITHPATIQTRPPWNPCTTIEPTPVLFIKPLPGTKKALGHFQRKPFKARPIPPSHAKPFRPILPSKVRQSSKQSKPDDKSPFPGGLHIRDDKPVAAESDGIEMPIEIPHVRDEIVEIPEKAAEMPAGSADRGLVSSEGKTVVVEVAVKQPDV